MFQTDDEPADALTGFRPCRFLRRRPKSRPARDVLCIDRLLNIVAPGQSGDASLSLCSTVARHRSKR